MKFRTEHECRSTNLRKGQQHKSSECLLVPYVPLQKKKEHCSSRLESLGNLAQIAAYDEPLHIQLLFYL